MIDIDSVNDIVILGMIRDAQAKHIEELEAKLRYANKRIEHAFERNDRQAQTIDNLTTKLAKSVEALDEAVYLLDPDEEDIAKETGLYRIVTTLKSLKGEQK